jgi:hypothetical protein
MYADENLFNIEHIKYYTFIQNHIIIILIFKINII